MIATLRKATSADIPALAELIAASVRGLQPEYSPRQREAALLAIFTPDRQLIADRTYFIAEVDGIIAGCGGWSKRKTLYGGDDAPGRDAALLDPSADPAKIRAFFIHPDFARRGIGSQILAACEDEAREAGFRAAEMAATLAGVPLYLARGYTELEPLTAPLPDGSGLALVRMPKQLTPNEA